MRVGGRLVHVVDDDEGIRRSIAFLLRTSGFVVQTWPSGAALLQSLDTLRPGCLLLDIRMPEMDGLAVQADLAERCQHLAVIVLTGHGDITTAVEAMRKGAIDFLEKPFKKTQLMNALDRGFARLSQAEQGAIGRRDAELRCAALTPREREVLAGLASGHANKQIAFNLDISPRTVEVHRANLMAKLRVHCLSDALRIAFAIGLGD